MKQLAFDDACPVVHPRGHRCSLRAGHPGKHKPILRHECHADGCPAEVPPKMLMCLKHWRMVPRPLQRRVWAAYRPGQEVDKNPSDEYLEVQRAAVAAVAAKEKP